MRSRAVFLPRACCFSTARSDPAWATSADPALEVGELAGGGVDVDARVGVGDVGAADGEHGISDGSVGLRHAGEPSLALVTRIARRRGLARGVGHTGPAVAGVEVHAGPRLDQRSRPRASRPWRVVVADQQQAGRGRLGRAWTTTPGRAPRSRCRCSCPRPAQGAGWVPLVAGLAVPRRRHGGRRRRQRRSSGPTTCSSPTDDDRKVVRHALRAAPRGVRRSALGVNVDQDARRAARRHGHLAAARGRTGGRAAKRLLTAYLVHLARWHGRPDDAGRRARVRAAYVGGVHHRGPRGRGAPGRGRTCAGCAPGVDEDGQTGLCGAGPASMPWPPATWCTCGPPTALGWPDVRRGLAAPGGTPGGLRRTSTRRRPRGAAARPAGHHGPPRGQPRGRRCRCVGPQVLARPGLPDRRRRRGDVHRGRPRWP